MLKHHLPNDDVFDEKRVFAPADVAGPFRIGPLRIGTPICEDAWYPDVGETLAETRGGDPAGARTARPITGASPTCG